MRMWVTGLAAIAGLYGAVGVGLAAAGAHLTGGTVVTTAAYFLLFHAGAMVALSVAATLLPRTAGICAATTLMAAGALLFSGDLALRGLAGITLIRLAAPTGGVLLILAWLGVAIALPVAIHASSKRGDLG